MSNNVNPQQVQNKRMQKAVMNTPNSTCKFCLGHIFKQYYVIKIVSGFSIRQSKDIIVPIPTFICSECKTPYGEGGPSEQEKV